MSKQTSAVLDSAGSYAQNLIALLENEREVPEIPQHCTLEELLASSPGMQVLFSLKAAPNVQALACEHFNVRKQFQCAPNKESSFILECRMEALLVLLNLLIAEQVRGYAVSKNILVGKNPTIFVLKNARLVCVTEE